MSSAAYDSFKEFFDFCSRVLAGENPKILDLIQHRYSDCQDEFRNSQGMVDLLKETKQKMEDKERLFIHLKEFTEVLKSNRKSKKKSVGGDKKKKQRQNNTDTDTTLAQSNLCNSNNSLQRVGDSCISHLVSDQENSNYCENSDGKTGRIRSCSLGDGRIKEAQVIRATRDGETVRFGDGEMVTTGNLLLKLQTSPSKRVGLLFEPVNAASSSALEEAINPASVSKTNSFGDHQSSVCKTTPSKTFHTGSPKQAQSSRYVNVATINDSDAIICISDSSVKAGRVDNVSYLTSKPLPVLKKDEKENVVKFTPKTNESTEPFELDKANKLTNGLSHTMSEIQCDTENKIQTKRNKNQIIVSNKEQNQNPSTNLISENQGFNITENGRSTKALKESGLEKLSEHVDKTVGSVEGLDVEKTVITSETENKTSTSIDNKKPDKGIELFDIKDGLSSDSLENDKSIVESQDKEVGEILNSKSIVTNSEVKSDEENVCVIGSQSDSEEVITSVSLSEKVNREISDESFSASNDFSQSSEIVNKELDSNDLDNIQLGKVSDETNKTMLVVDESSNGNISDDKIPESSTLNLPPTSERLSWDPITNDNVNHASDANLDTTATADDKSCSEENEQDSHDSMGVVDILPIPSSTNDTVPVTKQVQFLLEHNSVGVDTLKENASVVEVEDEDSVDSDVGEKGKDTVNPEKALAELKKSVNSEKSTAISEKALANSESEKSPISSEKAPEKSPTSSEKAPANSEKSTSPANSEKNVTVNEKRRVPLVCVDDIGSAKSSFLGTLSLGLKGAAPTKSKEASGSSSHQNVTKEKMKSMTTSKAVDRKEKAAEEYNSADEFTSAQTENFRRVVEDAKSKGKKPPSERHIKKLEQLLEKLRDEIEKGRELSLEDLDQEDSFYIYEDKLKKKFVAAWTKLCEITSRTVTTGRPTERTIHYDGTRYREINRRLEKFLNKRKMFPDFQDVKTIIQLTNKKCNLHLSAQMINDVAREAFVDIGEMLQTRRHQDFISTFGSRLTDTYESHCDPAFSDPVLRKKLESNRKVGRSNLDAVISKYSELQYSKGTAVDDDDDDEEDDDADEDVGRKSKHSKKRKRDKHKRRNEDERGDRGRRRRISSSSSGSDDEEKKKEKRDDHSPADVEDNAARKESLGAEVEEEEEDPCASPMEISSAVENVADERDCPTTSWMSNREFQDGSTAPKTHRGPNIKYTKRKLPSESQSRDIEEEEEEDDKEENSDVNYATDDFNTAPQILRNVSIISNPESEDETSESDEDEENDDNDFHKNGMNKEDDNDDDLDVLVVSSDTNSDDDDDDDDDDDKSSGPPSPASVISLGSLSEEEEEEDNDSKDNNKRPENEAGMNKDIVTISFVETSECNQPFESEESPVKSNVSNHTGPTKGLEMTPIKLDKNLTSNANDDDESCDVGGGVGNREQKANKDGGESQATSQKVVVFKIDNNSQSTPKKRVEDVVNDVVIILDTPEKKMASHEEGGEGILEKDKNGNRCDEGKEVSFEASVAGTSCVSSGKDCDGVDRSKEKENGSDICVIMDVRTEMSGSSVKGDDGSDDDVVVVLSQEETKADDGDSRKEKRNDSNCIKDGMERGEICSDDDDDDYHVRGCSDGGDGTFIKGSNEKDRNKTESEKDSAVDVSDKQRSGNTSDNCEENKKASNGGEAEIGVDSSPTEDALVSDDTDDDDILFSEMEEVTAEHSSGKTSCKDGKVKEKDDEGEKFLGGVNSIVVCVSDEDDENHSAEEDDSGVLKKSCERQKLDEKESRKRKRKYSEAEELDSDSGESLSQAVENRTDGNMDKMEVEEDEVKDKEEEEETEMVDDAIVKGKTIEVSDEEDGDDNDDDSKSSDVAVKIKGVRGESGLKSHKEMKEKEDAILTLKGKTIEVSDDEDINEEDGDDNDDDSKSSDVAVKIKGVGGESGLKSHKEMKEKEDAVLTLKGKTVEVSDEEDSDEEDDSNSKSSDVAVKIKGVERESGLKSHKEEMKEKEDAVLALKGKTIEVSDDEINHDIGEGVSVSEAKRGMEVKNQEEEKESSKEGSEVDGKVLGKEDGEKVTGMRGDSMGKERHVDERIAGEEEEEEDGELSDLNEGRGDDNDEEERKKEELGVGKIGGNVEEEEEDCVVVGSCEVIGVATGEKEDKILKEDEGEKNEKEDGKTLIDIRGDESGDEVCGSDVVERNDDIEKDDADGGEKNADECVVIESVEKCVAGAVLEGDKENVKNKEAEEEEKEDEDESVSGKVQMTTAVGKDMVVDLFTDVDSGNEEDTNNEKDKKIGEGQRRDTLSEIGLSVGLINPVTVLSDNDNTINGNNNDDVDDSADVNEVVENSQEWKEDGSEEFEVYMDRMDDDHHHNGGGCDFEEKEDTDDEDVFNSIAKLCDSIIQGGSSGSSGSSGAVVKQEPEDGVSASTSTAAALTIEKITSDQKESSDSRYRYKSITREHSYSHEEEWFGKLLGGRSLSVGICVTDEGELIERAAELVQEDGLRQCKQENIDRFTQEALKVGEFFEESKRHRQPVKKSVRCSRSKEEDRRIVDEMVNNARGCGKRKAEISLLSNDGSKRLKREPSTDESDLEIINVNFVPASMKRARVCLERMDDDAFVSIKEEDLARDDSSPPLSSTLKQTSSSFTQCSISPPNPVPVSMVMVQNPGSNEIEMIPISPPPPPLPLSSSSVSGRLIHKKFPLPATSSNQSQSGVFQTGGKRHAGPQSVRGAAAPKMTGVNWELIRASLPPVTKPSTINPSPSSSSSVSFRPPFYKGSSNSNSNTNNSNRRLTPMRARPRLPVLPPSPQNIGRMHTMNQQQTQSPSQHRGRGGSVITAPTPASQRYQPPAKRARLTNFGQDAKQFPPYQSRTQYLGAGNRQQHGRLINAATSSGTKVKPMASLGPRVPIPRISTGSSPVRANVPISKQMFCHRQPRPQPQQRPQQQHYQNHRPQSLPPRPRFPSYSNPFPSPSSSHSPSRHRQNNNNSNSNIRNLHHNQQQQHNSISPLFKTVTPSPTAQHRHHQPPKPLSSSSSISPSKHPPPPPSHNQLQRPSSHALAQARNAFVAEQQKKMDGLVMVLDDSDDENDDNNSNDKTKTKDIHNQPSGKTVPSGTTTTTVSSSSSSSSPHSTTGNSPRPGTSPGYNNNSNSNNNSPKPSSSSSSSPKKLSPPSSSTVQNNKNIITSFPSASSVSSPLSNSNSNKSSHNKNTTASPGTGIPGVTPKTTKKSAGVIVLSDSE